MIKTDPDFSGVGFFIARSLSRGSRTLTALYGLMSRAHGCAGATKGAPTERRMPERRGRGPPFHDIGNNIGKEHQVLVLMSI
jgi:hypothetical protein